MRPKHDRQTRKAWRWGGELRALLLLVLATAFLAQTFSWAARIPARPAAQAVEICVAHGVAVVMLDADGVPVEPPKSGPAHDCPLCPLIAGLSVAPDWQGFPAPPSVVVAVAPPFSGQSIIRSGVLSDAWARGPPTFVSA